MCLAIPGRIRAIDRSVPDAPVAEVDYGFVVRRANLAYLPDARLGEFVLVHAGFVTDRIAEAEAREAIEMRERMAAAAAGGSTRG